MRRGEVYLVRHPRPGDPRPRRGFVVVSRQALIDSRFSTLMCVPVYSTPSGVATEVPVGESEGLQHPSVARCDEVVSLPRRALTDYVGSLSPARLRELDRALIIALALEDSTPAP
jgi:mRNA interferase MazF